MRLPQAEVARRKTAVLKFFRKNPTTSVAKMNAALTKGELTGKPEKMLNIALGYAWRKEAIATPELPLSERLDAQGVPESPLLGGTPAPASTDTAGTSAGSVPVVGEVTSAGSVPVVGEVTSAGSVPAAAPQRVSFYENIGENDGD